MEDSIKESVNKRLKIWQDADKRDEERLKALTFWQRIKRMWYGKRY